MLSVIERGGAVLTSGAPAAIPTFSFIVYYNWDTQLVFVIVMERGPQVNQIRHGDVFLLKATSLVAKGAQSRMAVLAVSRSGGSPFSARALVAKSWRRVVLAGETA